MNKVHAAKLGVLAILLCCGCAQEEGMPLDQGKVIFDGAFPNDANKRDELERRDVVVATVEIESILVGTIESRDHNLALVFRTCDGEEKPLWKYVEYGEVTKITFDSSSSLLRVYYSRGFMRISLRVTEMNVRTFGRQERLISRGEWLW